MTNGKKNSAFLALIPEKTKVEIINWVSANYGILPNEAFEEVTNEESEHLLDYINGSFRNAVSCLMQKHGCR